MLIRKFASHIAAAIGLCFAAQAFADRVTVLYDDRTAAYERFRMVEEAQHELFVGYFAIGRDAVAMTLLNRLRAASRRGVRVTVVVDSFYNEIPPAMIAYLRSEGISILDYHSFGWNRPLQNLIHRFHGKLMVRDGVEMITGGRNIKRHYFGVAPHTSRYHFRDRDVLVRGAAAEAAGNFANELAQSISVNPTEVRRVTPSEISAAATLMDRFDRIVDRLRRTRLNPQNVPPAQVFESGVEFVHDPIGRRRGIADVAQTWINIIDSAEHYIKIETPYLIMPTLIRAAIRRAIARGVRVDILTNSLSSTDMEIPGSLGHLEARDVVAEGISLYEFHQHQTLHSKTIIADGRRAYVGTMNMDPRSTELDLEMGVVYTDPEAVAETERTVGINFGNSVRINDDPALPHRCLRGLGFVLKALRSHL